MRHLTCILVLSTLHSVGIGQVSTSRNLFYAKEFSKEIALYNAKIFVVQQVLGVSSEVVKFDIDPLAATGSGELTSLAYKCEGKSKQGLVLGFYGSRWNDAGVVYQGYSFLNLPSQKAATILAKLDAIIDENLKFLASDGDYNNIYFQIDDMTFLIYHKADGTKIRVVWNDFDSEWDYNAFKRTKKRLEKQMN